MEIHSQQDLFNTAGLSATPDGVFDIPKRLAQGVKGQITGVLNNYGDVGFYFQDAYISRIEQGKGEVIISFKINEKIYKFTSRFSIGISKKRRIIEFIYPFRITDEFEKTEFSSEDFGNNMKGILSQIQIYILNTIWKKEDTSKLAHL